MKNKLTTLILLVYIIGFALAAEPTVLITNPSADGNYLSGIQGIVFTISGFGATIDINANIYYSSTQSEFTNQIDLNYGLDNNSCDGINFDFETKCIYTWDTTAVPVDGDYFIDVNIVSNNDSVITHAKDSSDNDFRVDNTIPSVSIIDVNGDTSSPYWITTTQDINVNINTGENTILCKWHTSIISDFEDQGTACITNGTTASCNVGSSPETASTSNTVNYRCKDLAGNLTDNTSISYGVDLTNPTGSISIPTFVDNDVTVTYAGSDARSGIAKFEVKVDSESWVDKGSSSGSHTFTSQSNGDHNYMVRITDNVGNTYEISTIKNVNFTSSTNAPTQTPSISSDTHSDAWSTNDDPEFDWGTISDADFYRYDLNDDDDYTIGTGDSSTSSTSKNYSNRSDGEQWFHVAACNDSGCGPTDHYRIRIDDNSPGVVPNILGIPVSGPGIRLSWDPAIDKPSGDNSGIDYYIIYRNKSKQVGIRDFTPTDAGVVEYDNISDTTFTDRTGLITGISYYYRIRAIDNAGNQGSLSSVKRVLLTDTTCEITITSDIPEFVKAGPLNFEISVTGEGILDADVKIKMPGRAYETISINNSGTSIEEAYEIETGATGSANVLVSGEDEKGNVCEEIFRFTVDSKEPELTVNSPRENEKLEETITISVNASDGGTGIEKVEAFLDGTSIGELEKKNGNYELEFDTSTKTNGAHTLEIKAEDKAGNKAIEEIKVEFDNFKEAPFAEKIYQYNQSNLEFILEKAGVKKTVIIEAQELIKATNPKRKLVIRKTDSGLKAEVQLTINNSGETQRLQLIEVIPKGVANSASNIQSNTPFTIIQNDPVIKFELGEVTNGEEVKITYTVGTGLSEGEANSIANAFNNYKTPPIILDETREDIIEPPQELDLMLIGIIVIAAAILLFGLLLVIGGGAFIAHRVIKKRNKDRPQSEGLHTVYEGKISGFFGKPEEGPKKGKFSYKDK